MIHSQYVDGFGLRFWYRQHEVELGSAFLYVLRDTEHSRPFALVTGLQVPIGRSTDVGELLMRAMLKEAKSRECYKLMIIVPSEAVDLKSWCKRLGSTNSGLEFRFVPPLAPDEDK